MSGTGTAEGATCLNCKAVLHGAHCHGCGQPAHLHRTLGAIGHEIAHGVFHFEGKIWRTLPMLFRHPGDLTRRYVHGERARFVSPLALFLFSVFLTFAVFETIGAPIGGKGGVEMNVALPLAQSRTQLAELVRERDARAKAGGSTAAVDRRIADQRVDIAGLETTGRYLGGTAGPLDPAAVKIDTGSKAVDDRLREATANPGLLLYKLQSSAYKYAWAIIVLSLPFMWLMFPRRRDVHMYDHAIFVTYSLSFVMLLLVVAAIVSRAAGLGLAWTALVFPVHLFVQLRGAYGLSAAGAGVRTAALLLCAAVVLTIFAALLVLLGLLS